MKIQNPVIQFAQARQLRADRIAAIMERDRWFAYNMMKFLQAERTGRVVEPVAHNVALRLHRIALHRAQEVA